MGKAYDAAQKLYHEIQKADKVILFKTSTQAVHIIPNDKFQEILRECEEVTKKKMVSLFHHKWMEAFGYEVVLWNKEPGKPISFHSIISDVEEHEK